MGLKIAEFTYVGPDGGTKNAFMVWQGADISFDEGGTVRFGIYESADERARRNRRKIVVMPITQDQILEMFAMNGNVALSISDKSWELAQTVKFIDSRSVDGDNISIQQFSLDDLGAVITDIGLPQ